MNLINDLYVMDKSFFQYNKISECYENISGSNHRALNSIQIKFKQHPNRHEVIYNDLDNWPH